MEETLQLWDWREKIANLYSEIRTSSDVSAAWRLWRDTRSAMFRHHPQSPIEPTGRETFYGPSTFPYDPSLRLTVGLDAVTPEHMTVATGADGELSMRSFARTNGLEGSLGGELTLFWIEGYGGGVFLPFVDATSGTETYGGGRYLFDTIKGADLGVFNPNGTLVLDFNFSYFPSCAYSSRYVCPLAPSGNRLTGAVRAGERLIDDNLNKIIANKLANSDYTRELTRLREDNSVLRNLIIDVVENDANPRFLAAVSPEEKSRLRMDRIKRRRELLAEAVFVLNHSAPLKRPTRIQKIDS